MKNNPQPPTTQPNEDNGYAVATSDIEKTTPTVDAEFPSLQSDDTTSDVAIAYWFLAVLGMIAAMIQMLDKHKDSLDYILIASLIGSSITLLWMGHIVNYLKQIANKK